MAKYSIVVSVYNVAEYLPRCIDSIIGQTFKDFELILVDDGSTDDCWKICDSYQTLDNRIIVIHKKNGGVSSARNAGLEIATGEYITFCDSDDYYKENFLEKVEETICHQNVDLLCFNYESLHFNGQHSVSQISTGEYEFSSLHDRILFLGQKTFKTYTAWSVCSDIIRREIVANNELKFCTECNNYAEDIGFAVKVLLHCNSVIGISDALYVYDRTRENSMMNSSKGTFRLQDINAVSMDVEQEFNRVVSSLTEKNMYSIIHCLFMKDQYDGIAWADKMRSLPEEVEKISEQNWYRTRTITVRDNQDTLNLIFGNIVARDIIVVARYCLHKNYYRYLIEMRLAHHCPILFDKYSLHSQL